MGARGGRAAAADHDPRLPGALWFYGDSFVYLGASLRPQPNLSKATGYSFFLRALLPFHSLTLVVTLQHLMGLAVAVMIYVLLRRNGVSKLWSTVATLPQLLDGYIIEDEHMIMTETLFTFLLMVAMLMLLWKPRPVWWKMLVAGLVTGCAALVRTDGEVMYVVFPLFLLLRGMSWKTVRGWLMAIAFAVASLVPYAAYAGWFHDYYPQYHKYDISLAEGFFLWGRVSSFANCAVIQQTPAEAAAKICPTDAIADRTPPGNFVWENPYIHSSFLHKGFSPVTPASDKLLTGFAEHADRVAAAPVREDGRQGRGAVVRDPADRLPRARHDLLLQLPHPLRGRAHRHQQGLHHAAAEEQVLDRLGHPVPIAPTRDWLAYGHQTPGVVNKVFAAPILVYERVVFTWGPLLAVIFLVGLGGVISVSASAWRRGQGLRAALSFRTLRSVRLHWSPRGTSMLPWVTAVALLVVPIMVADFDYRYLIPVIPFACMAAGLGFAPRRAKPDPAAPSAPSSATVESTVPDSVS